MKKLFVLLLSFVVAAPIAFAQENSQATHRQILQAVRSGDLHAAAKLSPKRQYVTSLTPPEMWTRKVTKASLRTESDLIVVARAAHSTSRIAHNDALVESVTPLEILRVLKGSAPSSAVVLTPGGKVRFDDGTSAEVRTSYFKPMKEGQTYLLFLKSHGSDEYVITSHPAGLMEIDAAGKIRPEALKFDTVYAETNAVESNQLLNELAVSTR